MARRQYIQNAALHIYAANPNGGPAGAIERAILLADHLDANPATAFEPEVKRVTLGDLRASFRKTSPMVPEPEPEPMPEPATANTCASCVSYEAGGVCRLLRTTTGPDDVCDWYE
jgi:hypothetical protein